MNVSANMKSNHTKIIKLKANVPEGNPENEMILAMAALLGYIDRRIEDCYGVHEEIKEPLTSQAKSKIWIDLL